MFWFLSRCERNYFFGQIDNLKIIKYLVYMILYMTQ